MAYTTTVLNQLHNLLPLQEFQSFVRQHEGDKYVKKMSCKNQLSILLYAQATGKDSLRDIETSLLVQDSSWYHLGITTVARSTLAKANENRPYQIYESLFYELLKKCMHFNCGTASFKFENALYAIDASVINLCLSLFPWSKFGKEKGAIKIHSLFNVRSQIPEVIQITKAKEADITVARKMNLSKYPKGTIFIFDLAYLAYAFLWKINKTKHHFVSRIKKNTQIYRIKEHKPPLGKGVIKDEIVAFTEYKAEKDYPDDLRLVTYYDEETDVTYEFLTNEFDLDALDIAEIYKNRWQIELFFKWIKQHLKIKTFLGTSENAVMTQIWIAMIYYLLVSWLKFQTKFEKSLLTLTRILEVSILKPVSIINLLNLTPGTVTKVLARAGPSQIPLF